MCIASADEVFSLQIFIIIFYGPLVHTGIAIGLQLATRVKK